MPFVRYCSNISCVLCVVSSCSLPTGFFSGRCWAYIAVGCLGMVVAVRWWWSDCGLPTTGCGCHHLFVLYELLVCVYNHWQYNIADYTILSTCQDVPCLWKICCLYTVFVISVFKKVVIFFFTVNNFFINEFLFPECKWTFLCIKPRFIH